MTNRPGFQHRMTLLQQRINAELDVIETRYNRDYLGLAKLLADVEMINGKPYINGKPRADIERAATERARAMVLEHFTAVFSIPGITIDQAGAAVQQMQDRAFKRWG